MTDGPLIVQSDKTALLEVDHPQAVDARHDLAVFAELERAPEHVRTYRITRLGLWNARAAGHDAEFVLGVLDRYAKFAVPTSVRTDITETMGRYGRLIIERDDAGELILTSQSSAVLVEVTRQKKIAELLTHPQSQNAWSVAPWARGQLKQELLKIGWPAEDLAGYVEGTPHDIALNQSNWQIRGYQSEAVDKFWNGGSGVVVLPCGAGKTIVGAAAMSVAKTNTLILVTNTVSARQWKSELIRRTTLTEDEIGECSGSLKEIKPVTIATYQILTTKRKTEYTHLSLLNAERVGFGGL
jgi:DNA excision repair protein ERCC-3